MHALNMGIERAKGQKVQHYLYAVCISSLNFTFSLLLSPAQKSSFKESEFYLP